MIHPLFGPQPLPQVLSNTAGYTEAARRILLEIGWLPGVARVFPASSAMSKWFGSPVTHFRSEERSMQAWITIAVGRFQSSAEVTGLVVSYVRARLTEQGFDLIEIRVRVALLT